MTGADFFGAPTMGHSCACKSCLKLVTGSDAKGNGLKASEWGRETRIETAVR